MEVSLLGKCESTHAIFSSIFTLKRLFQGNYPSPTHNELAKLVGYCQKGYFSQEGDSITWNDDEVNEAELHKLLECIEANEDIFQEWQNYLFNNLDYFQSQYRILSSKGKLSKVKHAVIEEELRRVQEKFAVFDSMSCIAGLLEANAKLTIGERERVRERFIGSPEAIADLQKRQRAATLSVSEETPDIGRATGNSQIHYDTYKTVEAEYIILVPKPLSNNAIKPLLSSCMSTLEGYYSKQNKIKRLLYRSTLPIEDIFVSLCMVENENIYRKRAAVNAEIENAYRSSGSKNPGEGTYILTNDGGLHKKGSPILLEDLFSNFTIERVLILGAPGIGKTTLCKYITHQWVNKRLWTYDESTQLGFHWIFHVQLRNLLTSFYIKEEKLREEFRGEDANLLLAKIIHHEIYGDTEEVSIEEIKSILKEGRKKNKKKRVLLILDGWDEVSKHYYNSSLQCYEILNKLMEYPTLLITSRPSEVPDCVDRYIINTGLNDEQVNDYINKFFKSLQPEELKRNTKDNIATLIAYLKDNLNVRDMARIPIVLEILATLWNEKYSNKTFSIPHTSLSQILKNIVNFLHERYEERQRNNKKLLLPKELLIQPLCELAYDHLTSKSGKKIIAQTIINNFYPKEENLQDIVDFGIIKPIYARRDLKYNDFDFIHLTFQEYLAALHWVNLFCSSNKHQRNIAEMFFRENKFALDYEVMWGLAAGILKDRIKNDIKNPIGSNPISRLNAFFKIIMDSPYDLIGARYMAVLIRCLGECEGFSGIKDIGKLLNQVMQWFSDKGTRDINKDYLRAALRNSRKLVQLLQFPMFEKFIESVNANESTSDYWYHFLSEMKAQNFKAELSTLSGLQNQEEFIFKLLSCLKQKNWHLKHYAIMTIKEIYPELSFTQRKECLSFLTELLQEESCAFSQKAAKILLLAYTDLSFPQKSGLISSLLKWLYSESASTALEAIELIISYPFILSSDQREELVDRLIHYLQSEDSDCATEKFQLYFSSMTAIQQKHTLEKIMAYIASKGYSIKYEELKLLHFLFPYLTEEKKEELYQKIMALLQNENYQIQMNAVKFLKTFYPNANVEQNEKIILSLSNMMRQKNNKVRSFSVENLREYFPVLSSEGKKEYIVTAISLLGIDLSCTAEAERTLISLYPIVNSELNELIAHNLFIQMHSDNVESSEIATRYLISFHISSLSTERKIEIFCCTLPCILSEKFSSFSGHNQRLLLKTLDPSCVHDQIETTFHYFISRVGTTKDAISAIAHNTVGFDFFTQFYPFFDLSQKGQLLNKFIACLRSKENYVSNNAARVLLALYTSFTACERIKFLHNCIDNLYSDDCLKRLSPILFPEDKMEVIQRLFACCRLDDFFLRLKAAELLQPHYNLFSIEEKAEYIQKLIVCLQSETYRFKLHAAEILSPLYLFLKSEEKIKLITEVMVVFNSEDSHYHRRAIEILLPHFSILQSDQQRRFLCGLMCWGLTDTFNYGFEKTLANLYPDLERIYFAFIVACFIEFLPNKEIIFDILSGTNIFSYLTQEEKYNMVVAIQHHPNQRKKAEVLTKISNRELISVNNEVEKKTIKCSVM